MKLPRPATPASPAGMPAHPWARGGFVLAVVASLVLTGCARESEADLIASGDKRDLLPMGSFQGIPIITAREAVERLEARSKT